MVDSNEMKHTDRVYAEPLPNTPAFEFNGQVADVFENMIDRSVPGYGLMLDMIALMTAHFAQPGSNCYDLGCSLGASTLRIRQQLPASCNVIGVDSSPDMVIRARRNVERDHSEAGIVIALQDARETPIENASVVVMNFTLQFIPDEDRSRLLRRIADGLNDNGILVLCSSDFADTATWRSPRSVPHWRMCWYPIPGNCIRHVCIRLALQGSTRSCNVSILWPSWRENSRPWANI
jgi:tRNA (cmo5U34)-methyltransferase